MEKAKPIFTIKPRIEGIEEMREAIDEASRHLAAARDLIDGAGAMTLTVTASVEPEARPRP